MKGDSPLADRSLADSEIRQKFGVIIIGIKRHDGQMEFNPGPDAVIHAGDELLVLGPLQRMKALEETVGR